MPNGRSTPAATAALLPRDCPAAILAGGRSSRFGSDKAMVLLDGRPLLLALHGTLRGKGHVVHVVADRADRYRRAGLECLVDRVADCGPIAGLATALERRLTDGEGWLLVLSCDQLVWLPAWFDELAQAAVRPENVDVEAFYFTSRATHEVQTLQPLPCLLHTRLLPDLLRRIERQQLSLQSLMRESRSQAIVAAIDPKSWSFNTAEELAKLSGQLP